MKHTPVLCAVFCALMLASIPARAAADVTLVRGDGALASFEHESADGCVRTVGEIALLDSSQGGELADGLYLTGSQENVCLGTGNGFATLVEGSFPGFGLFYAHYEGTVVAESYSSGEPITFDINLSWFGTGRVIREHNVSHESDALEFTFSARRAANPVGHVLANGVAMHITSATLVHQINGTLSH